MHFLKLSPSSLSLCCHGMVSSQNLEFIKFFHFRYGQDGQRYGRQDLPAATEADGRPGPRRRTASFKPVPPGKAGPRPAILLLLILAGRGWSFHKRIAIVLDTFVKRSNLTRCFEGHCSKSIYNCFSRGTPRNRPTPRTRATGSYHIEVRTLSSWSMFREQVLFLQELCC